jgi:hypothetical protein
MRRILIALAMILCFSANQAAMAFEQCEDISCVTGTMDAQKQAEHQKKDPACAGHCSVSSHHAAALPQVAVMAPITVEDASPLWNFALTSESFNPEGLIEPPSLA